jgi:hypothetical protein
MGGSLSVNAVNPIECRENENNSSVIKTMGPKAW